MKISQLKMENKIQNKGKVVKPDLPVRSFTKAKELDAWLAKHHAVSSGIWIRFFKKKTGISAITYSEALDAALCYGWIDGQKKPYDTESWLQKFTQRRPKSLWSKRNREHIVRLEKSGEMKPAGTKQVGGN